jgi:hypothetical protein
VPEKSKENENMKQIIILVTIVAALIIPAVTIAQQVSRPSLSRGLTTNVETQADDQIATKMMQGKTEWKDAALSLLWASVALAAVWLGGRKEDADTAFKSLPDRFHDLPRRIRTIDSPIRGRAPGFELKVLKTRKSGADTFERLHSKRRTAK